MSVLPFKQNLASHTRGLMIALGVVLLIGGLCIPLWKDYMRRREIIHDMTDAEKVLAALRAHAHTHNGKYPDSLLVIASHVDEALLYKKPWWGSRFERWWYFEGVNDSMDQDQPLIMGAQVRQGSDMVNFYPSRVLGLLDGSACMISESHLNAWIDGHGSRYGGTDKMEIKPPPAYNRHILR